MTFLMVNLDDPNDCRRAIEQLKPLAFPGRPGCGPRGRHGGGRPHEGRPGDGPGHAPLGRHGEANWGAYPPPPPPPPPPPGRRRGPRATDELRPMGGPLGETSSDELLNLPLPDKLRRIAQRGVFAHLMRIAAEVDRPMSLPELDRTLGFNANKMRSLKAIMAKLERRWGLEFLIPSPAGEVDDQGNPRYVMPPKLRKQILKIAAQIDRG